MDFKEKNRKKLRWYLEEIEMWENRFTILSPGLILSTPLGDLVKVAKQAIDHCLNHIDKHQSLQICNIIEIITVELTAQKCIGFFKDSTEFAIGETLNKLKVDINLKNKTDCIN